MKRILSKSSSKSFIIFLTSFFLILLYLFKQAETKLNEFYHQRQFMGEVSLHSFLPSFENVENFNPREVTLYYTYSEEVDGKEIKIPMEMKWPWTTIIMPHYRGEFDIEPLGKGEFPFVDFRESEAYRPIYQKALELHPKRVELEQQIKQALNEVPYFEGAKIRFSINEGEYYGDFDSERYKALKGGATDLGGALDSSLPILLRERQIIVDIRFEGEKYSPVFRENLLQAVANGLPDGLYRLNEDERTWIYDGKHRME